ncbi:MAG: TraB/GumN family protein, partial [Verrucomicrobiales bacterium]|nr:TraB/GumN family protein [Verrucomicrobiales bacterium]
MLLRKRDSPAVFRFLLISVCAALSVTARCSADGTKLFLWKGINGGATVYLLGSFHALHPSDYPLPAAFETAFTKSSEVAFETDLDLLVSPNFVAQLTALAFYPSGQTIRQQIPNSTYEMLRSYASDTGRPATFFDTFRPWFVSVTIAAEQYQNQGFSSDLGVDRHFYDKAKLAQKQLASLETPESQLFVFSGLSAELQAEDLNDVLTNLASFPADTERLLNAWKTGDTASLAALFSPADPAIYARVLSDRNRAWLPKIESYFGSPGVRMVIVGAGHLTGKDSVIDLLRSKSYDVQQLEGPALLQQPTSVTTTAGASVTISVEVTGTPPLAFQWYRDSLPLAGVTSRTFTISAAHPSDSGEYRVKVSNEVEEVESDTATLAVKTSPLPTLTATRLESGWVRLSWPKSAGTSVLQSSNLSTPVTWAVEPNVANSAAEEITL